MDIIKAIEDPNLFKPWFEDTKSWVAWIAFLKVLFAHQNLNRKERRIFESCTGRSAQHDFPHLEAWLICGRRGGKSFITALIAVFLGCFYDFSQYLSKGERGHIMILACDKKQSRVIFRYISALIKNVPILEPMIIRSTTDAIDLNNNISIEIQTSSHRSVRGFTVVAALCDEIAFWRNDESASPDKEIIDALLPAMATIPNALLIGLGSPYSKRGVLYEAYKKHYGQNKSDVLVWQAPTEVMNPSINKNIIKRAYEKDPISAASEYGAQFRSDLAAFISEDALNAVTELDLTHLPYNSNYQYVAFTDPSGGSKDSWTLAISHNENDITILDYVGEIKPPFSPESVVKTFSSILKEYQVFNVTGDAYAGEFPRELFSKQGISYTVSTRNRSQIYLEILPLIMSIKIQLLDNKKLIAQLSMLERRTARSGKDSVDHPVGGHDDLANSAAGVLVLASLNNSINVGEIELFGEIESSGGLYGYGVSNGLF